MSSIVARAPLLLMAHHRSGSNFLHDLLQSHPKIECINEPFSMHTRFFRQCDLVRWTEADYDPAVLHVALAKHAGLRSYLRELRQYLLQSSSERVIGFKETALFGKLEWLKEFMPDFWLYRNLVPKAFREMFPHYRSAVDAGDMSGSDAELVAMSVVTRYELAYRTLCLFEHRMLMLRAVMHDPAASLQVVTDFLGLEPHPQQMAFLCSRRGVSRGGTFSSFRAADDVEHTWRRHLSPRQVEVIEHVLFAAQCVGTGAMTV
jgi:hypothetical protein